jgi:ribosomal protein L37E
LQRNRAAGFSLRGVEKLNRAAVLRLATSPAGFDAAQARFDNAVVDDGPNTPSPTTNHETGSPAPNWDHVPFDVGCARCGHDLRGLTEPKCPACGLEFDWSEAVPLEELTCLHCGYHLYGLSETRCPECGSPFTWEDVLDDYRRRKKPFFEYQWRRRPVRSLVQTWFWALRPSRLWARFDIHDPPQVKPLLALVAIALVAFALTFTCLSGLQIWLSRWLYWTRGWSGWRPSWFDLPRSILDVLTGVTPSLTFLIVAWVFTSFAALMVFRQSMWRCKVRTVHVLRVWAHAVPLMLVTTVVIVVLLIYVDMFWPGSYSVVTVELVVLTFLFHVTWSLRCGYKTYLRMDHSLAVGVASQLMAILAAVSLYDTVGPGNQGASILLEIDRLVGLF